MNFNEARGKYDCLEHLGITPYTVQLDEHFSKKLYISLVTIDRGFMYIPVKCMSYLSNTLTNLCIAFYCILLYCVILNCIVLLIYCYVDIIQYNAMHKFVGVLDNPHVCRISFSNLGNQSHISRKPSQELPCLLCRYSLGYLS